MTEAELIQHHEGLRLKAYEDTTGHMTLGYGHCLTCKGISLRAAQLIFEDDVADVRKDLESLAWFVALDAARQAVIVDMAFNMGTKGVLEFRTFIHALQAGDYEAAARDMLESKWAHQTHTRATENARIIREGTL